MIRRFNCFCCFVLIFYLIPLANYANNSSKKSINVEHLNQPVKYRESDEMDWKSLPDTLSELPASGDVMVKEDGAVELDINNVSNVKINEQSGIRYELDEDSPPDVFLNHGSVKMNVDDKDNDNNKVKLRTPHATIGVRGTEFGVSYEQSEFGEAYVNGGRVYVESDRTVKTIDPGLFTKFGYPQSNQRVTTIIETGELKPKHRHIWEHWNLQKQLTHKNRRIRVLRVRIRRMDDTDQKNQLNQQLEKLKDEKRSLQERYASVKNQYDSYRERLLQKRENFINERRREFNQYRRNVIEEFRQQKQDSKNRDDEIRQENEQKLDDIRDQYDDF